MIRSFCFSSSNYFKKHGFGNPVVPKEGLFCAALNRQSKEFCRTRVESVSSPEKVRVLHYISFKCGHIVHCTYVVPKILSIAFVYLTTECLSWAYMIGAMCQEMFVGFSVRCSFMVLLDLQK